MNGDEHKQLAELSDEIKTSLNAFGATLGEHTTGLAVLTNEVKHLTATQEDMQRTNEVFAATVRGELKHVMQSHEACKAKTDTRITALDSWVNKIAVSVSSLGKIVHRLQGTSPRRVVLISGATVGGTGCLVVLINTLIENWDKIFR